ncbi:MAG: ABC transporter ATP-binding protein [Chloroflexota bacterium]
MHVLEVSSLSRYFGGVKAVDGVSFDVSRGRIVSIIGPNGAGKTTLFNCLTGVIKPTSGSILFEGRDLASLPPHRITEAGVVRTFQNIRLFPEMSVLENVMVAQHTRHRYGLLSAVWRGTAFRSREQAIRDKALECLRFVGIDRYAGLMAGRLPYGSQRRLEIARGLAAEPKLVLLDEPTAGMNPTETSEVMSLIERVRVMGKTILLIEHDMRLVMGISDEIIVLDHGVKIAEGSPEEVRNNSLVIEAYLGREELH